MPGLPYVGPLSPRWKIRLSIRYTRNYPLSTDEFVDLLKASTLGERRPVEDKTCMQGMVDNAGLTITAWDGEELVGVARSVTDFHYACYLSDLAVTSSHQKMGIGKALIEHTRQALAPSCKLILLSAPKANDYYPKLGFSAHPRCWIME